MKSVTRNIGLYVIAGFIFWQAWKKRQQTQVAVQSFTP